jgi:hypothetical protein
VLKSAIDFISNEFGFDKLTCEDTRSFSKLSRKKLSEDKKGRGSAEITDHSSYEKILAKYRPASPTN